MAFDTLGKIVRAGLGSLFLLSAADALAAKRPGGKTDVEIRDSLTYSLSSQNLFELQKEGNDSYLVLKTPFVSVHSLSNSVFNGEYTSDQLNVRIIEKDPEENLLRGQPKKAVFPFEQGKIKLDEWISNGNFSANLETKPGVILANGKNVPDRVIAILTPDYIFSTNAPSLSLSRNSVQGLNNNLTQNMPPALNVSHLSNNVPAPSLNNNLTPDIPTLTLSRSPASGLSSTGMRTSFGNGYLAETLRPNLEPPVGRQGGLSVRLERIITSTSSLGHLDLSVVASENSPELPKDMYIVYPQVVVNTDHVLRLNGFLSGRRDRIEDLRAYYFSKNTWIPANTRVSLASSDPKYQALNFSLPLRLLRFNQEGTYAVVANFENVYGGKETDVAICRVISPSAILTVPENSQNANSEEGSVKAELVGSFALGHLDALFGDSQVRMGGYEFHLGGVLAYPLLPNFTLGLYGTYNLESFGEGDLQRRLILGENSGRTAGELGLLTHVSLFEETPLELLAQATLAYLHQGFNYHYDVFNFKEKGQGLRATGDLHLFRLIYVGDLALGLNDKVDLESLNLTQFNEASGVQTDYGSKTRIHNDLHVTLGLDDLGILGVGWQHDSDYSLNLKSGLNETELMNLQDQQMQGKVDFRTLTGKNLQGNGISASLLLAPSSWNGHRLSLYGNIPLLGEVKRTGINATYTHPAGVALHVGYTSIDEVLNNQNLSSELYSVDLNFGFDTFKLFPGFRTKQASKR